MFRFEIDQYQSSDAKALQKALGRRRPVRRTISWVLRLALLAVGLLFGLTVVFFWGTYFGSGPAAALKPGSNDLAVAVVCHALCFLALIPALGCGWFSLRRLRRAQNRQTPLAVALDGEEISLELRQWTDSLPWEAVETVFRVRECWILFLKNRRVLVLPERCLTRGGAYSLESFFESRCSGVKQAGGMRKGV